MEPSSGASDSAWTMQSTRRSELVVSEVDMLRVEELVEQEARSWGGPYTEGVARRSLQLVSGAGGGACIILAPDEELHKLAPHAHVSDGSGMTQRLRGISVASGEFEQLFHEFAQHSATDRWPTDHPDELLRGRPKDGVGALLSPTGFRVKCAVRLEGLPQPPWAWSCMGMRHNAALAATAVMQAGLVFLRSESGMVHVLAKSRARLLALCVDDGHDCHISSGSEVMGPTDTSQTEVIEDTDFEALELEAGKLVMHRQELEEQLTALRWTFDREPSLEVAAALHDLAVVCREGGDLFAARQHLQESLDMKGKLLGSGPSAELAASLHELGLVHREIRHLRMAQRALEQALQMKQALGASDVDVTRRELGAVCVERRRLWAAQRHLEGVLKSANATLDASPEEVTERARALRELGLLYMKGGNFHHAQDQLLEALHLERSLHHSTSHPDVAKTLYSLGLVALRSGDHISARSHLEESLKMSRAVYGDTPHPDVQKVLRLLAALSARDGDISSWRASRKEAMRMHKAIHHTEGIAALPARLDMMGLFLVERALAVRSHCTPALDSLAAATAAATSRGADRLRRSLLGDPSQTVRLTRA